MAEKYAVLLCMMLCSDPRRCIVQSNMKSHLFCCLQRDDGSSDTDAADPDKIAGLAAEFKRRANMLYTLLQSNKLQSSQRAPYLRQFLLRINYNGYVENEAVRQLRQGDAMLRGNT